MKAVVLAAGRGQRLNADTPKPLAEFLGVPLLERWLRIFERLGIGEVCIVVGYEAETVGNFARRAAEKRALDVEIIKNDAWETGNLSSLLAAKAAVADEPFVLAMCDSVFPLEAVKAFIKGASERGNYLATSKPTAKDDIDEAVKVKIEGGRIVALGKRIDEFDAIDTGLFILTPQALELLEDRYSSGETEFWKALSAILPDIDLKSIDISDFVWHDLDTKEDFALAEQKFFDALTSKARDGIVARTINRRISRLITKRLIRTDLTPNQLSAATFLVSLLAAPLYIFGQAALAGVFVQLGSILDGVDGEIARLKIQQSRWGAIFDSILDRIADSLILISIGVGSYLAGAKLASVAVTAAALVLWPLVMLSVEKRIAITKEDYDLSREGWQRLLLTNRDGRSFLVFLSSIVGRPLLGVAVSCALICVQLVIRLISWRSELANT